LLQHLIVLHHEGMTLNFWIHNILENLFEYNVMRQLNKKKVYPNRILRLFYLLFGHNFQDLIKKYLNEGFFKALHLYQKIFILFLDQLNNILWDFFIGKNIIFDGLMIALNSLIISFKSPQIWWKQIFLSLKLFCQDECSPIILIQLK